MAHPGNALFCAPLPLHIDNRRCNMLYVISGVVVYLFVAAAIFGIVLKRARASAEDNVSTDDQIDLAITVLMWPVIVAFMLILSPVIVVIALGRWFAK